MVNGGAIYCATYGGNPRLKVFFDNDDFSAWGSPLSFIIAITALSPEKVEESNGGKNIVCKLISHCCITH